MHAPGTREWLLCRRHMAPPSSQQTSCMCIDSTKVPEFVLPPSHPPTLPTHRVATTPVTLCEHEEGAQALPLVLDKAPDKDVPRGAGQRAAPMSLVSDPCAGVHRAVLVVMRALAMPPVGSPLPGVHLTAAVRLRAMPLLAAPVPLALVLEGAGGAIPLRYRQQREQTALGRRGPSHAAERWRWATHVSCHGRSRGSQDLAARF
jgi:hypothetical protein